MTNVSHKLETIKSIFLETQQFYEKHNNIETLIKYLQNLQPEFRSIGYEAISMAIALNDFVKENNLNTWLHFANGPAFSHAAQVHVGLGWAIANKKLPFLSLVEKIEPHFYYRIADGCGYYDGFFRQRQTINHHHYPIYINNNMWRFYDQGIGRSLWYSSHADISKVKKRIKSFTAERQKDLWRGVGIAIAYVGGCDNATLRMIFDVADDHKEQLTIGASLAAKSRMEANTITVATNLCSRLWLNLCIEEGLVSVDICALGKEDVYLEWITKTEFDLSNNVIQVS